jgi:membrane-bound ClpP family serine protease
VSQVIQVIGSLLVLAAFAAAQRGLLDPKSVVYLVLNLMGSATLAVEALLVAQWGFLLLEGVWALVSAAGLITLRRRPGPSPA